MWKYIFVGSFVLFLVFFLSDANIDHIQTNIYGNVKTSVLADYRL